MNFRTVINQIFNKYSTADITELKEIFSSKLALPLKAEMLTGNGDMLYQDPRANHLERLQGFYL